MNKEFIIILSLMIFSGVISRLWIDELSFIKFGIKDLIMVFLMLGWSQLFLGIYNKNLYSILIGIFLIIFFSVYTYYINKDIKKILNNFS